MNESQISVRYAKALFQSASEKKLLKRVQDDMEMLAEICKLKEFQYMLAQPSLETSKKCKIAESIFARHFSELSLSMVILVIRNKRELFLSGIARYFGDLYRKAMAIRKATLITAHEVDEKILKQIGELIRKAYQAEVEMAAVVNKNIIGGFVLTVEDRQYDASVSGQLRKMKKQLLKSSFEKR